MKRFAIIVLTLFVQMLTHGQGVPTKYNSIIVRDSLGLTTTSEAALRTRILRDGSVTLPKAGTSLLNYIDASGGGTITNLPDEANGLDVTHEDPDLIGIMDGGVTWTKISGALQDSISKAKRGIDSLRAREVNVKDFGAVGDGVTDDSSAIADAIAAADDGSTVVMRGMTSKVVGSITVNKALTLLLDNSTLVMTNSSLIIDADSVTLTGTNKFTSIIQQNDTTEAAIVVFAGSDYVTIENITVRGAGREWYYELPREESNGIQFQGGAESFSRNMTVQNCYFTKNVIDILVQYAAGGKFVLNTFEASHIQSIQVNLWHTSYFNVSLNTFTALGSASVVDAIEFVGVDTTTTGNVISENTVEGNYTFEVFNLFSMYNSVVSSNTIDVTGIISAAIALSTSGTDQATAWNTISSNTIRLNAGTTGSGIAIAKCTSCGDATTFPTDNTVINNTIYQRGTGWGIVVGDSSHRNTFSENKIFIVSPSTDGIFVGKARNILITGNTITSSVTDTLRYGIFLNGTESVTIALNTFRHLNEAIAAGTGGTMSLTLVLNEFDSCGTPFQAGSGTVKLFEIGNNTTTSTNAIEPYGDFMQYQPLIPTKSAAGIAAATTAANGVLIYDTDNHVLKVRANGSWKTLTFDP